MLPLFGRRRAHVEPVAKVGHIVDKHVNPAGSVCRDLDRAFDIHLFGNVGRGKLRLPSLFVDLPRNCRTRVAINIGNEHPRALFSEQLGDCAADTMGGTGNNRHSVCESRHYSSVVWSDGGAKSLWCAGVARYCMFASGWPRTPMVARVIVYRSRLAT